MIIAKSTDVNTYLNHGLSDPLVQFYMKQGGERLVVSLPICPKCERTGLRDKGWTLHKTMVCPHCGYRGHATHQLSTYLREGLYR